VLCMRPCRLQNSYEGSYQGLFAAVSVASCSVSHCRALQYTWTSLDGQCRRWHRTEGWRIAVVLVWLIRLSASDLSIEHVNAMRP
jgi:hypothetical protein